ncbi:MAG: ABC transporter permease [Planctomycetota bacterium]
MTTSSSPGRDESSGVSSRPKDWIPYLIVGTLAGAYVILLLAMVVALATYTSPPAILGVLARAEIQASIGLTLVSSTAATAMAMVFSLALAIVLSRFEFPGRSLLDAILDLPHVMPPLVLGLSLLVLFQTMALRPIAAQVVYQAPAVLLAHFVIAVSYAVPVLRSALHQCDVRPERFALTLGCSRASAFWLVTVPRLRAAMVTAAALAWARCVGTFGPLLVFAGAMRHRTEVLATSIYLELNVGDLESAVAVSMVLITLSVCVLTGSRLLGLRQRRQGVRP